MSKGFDYNRNFRLFPSNPQPFLENDAINLLSSQQTAWKIVFRVPYVFLTFPEWLTCRWIWAICGSHGIRSRLREWVGIDTVSKPLVFLDYKCWQDIDDRILPGVRIDNGKLCWETHSLEYSRNWQVIVNRLSRRRILTKAREAGDG